MPPPRQIRFPRKRSSHQNLERWSYQVVKTNPGRRFSASPAVIKVLQSRYPRASTHRKAGNDADSEPPRSTKGVPLLTSPIRCPAQGSILPSLCTQRSSSVSSSWLRTDHRAIETFRDEVGAPSCFFDRSSTLTSYATLIPAGRNPVPRR